MEQPAIIDVEPIEASRPTPTATAASAEFVPPSYGRKPQPKKAGGAKSSKGAASGAPDLVGGAVQTAAGAAVMAVGVPLLVLPGPGLATIAGGAAIASGGIKKMTGQNGEKAAKTTYVTIPPDGGPATPASAR